ncbi:MAG: hypothetical protein AAF721_19695 [Myxococcota bacterium]
MPSLIAGVFAAAVALAGCRGESLPIDCDNQATKFRNQMLDEEQPLLDAVPESGPYPVAFQLTEEGVNRLLGKKVNEADIPFTGTLPFGPAGFEFEPESDPVIRFADLPDCPNCLLLTLEFQVQLLNAGDPLSTGFGAVDLSIPMELEADEAAGVTRLIADYGRVNIEDMSLSVYGFSSEEHMQYAGAIRILLTERLQEEFGAVELMSIGSWTIGDGNIRLLARELLVYPDAGKLALGMHTNLPLPEAAGLFLDAPLPEGVPMAVTFDSRIFLSMSHRMLAEGQIPRRYDENGQADERGIYAVTLDQMVGNNEGASQLDSEFNVWRIANGLCGNVRAAMPLTLEIVENRKGFRVAAGGATLLEGEGSGLQALEEKEIVDENEDLIDTFRGALADSVGSTINYDAFDVEGSLIVIEVADLTVNPLEVNSLLDFRVFDDPNAEPAPE